MNKILISIGSNEHREKNISLCREMLSSRFGQIVFSKAIESKPYGEQYSNMFVNQLLEIRSESTIEEVNQVIKDIEHRLGRKPEHKALGRVPIDVDILIWNDVILKHEDMQRDYVGVLMREMDL